MSNKFYTDSVEITLEENGTLKVVKKIYFTNVASIYPDMHLGSITEDIYGAEDGRVVRLSSNIGKIIYVPQTERYNWS